MIIFYNSDNYQPKTAIKHHLWRGICFAKNLINSLLSNLKHLKARSSVLVFLLLMTFASFTYSQNSDCEVTLEIDLSNSPTASWSTTEAIIAGNECCGMPPYYNCFELIVWLHPDARALEIEITSEVGELYYFVGCEGGYDPVPENRKVKICTENPSEPVSITFCRINIPPISLNVTSLPSGLEVDFQPFPDICLNDDPVVFDHATPAGGLYYINEEANHSAAFDPSVYGPGSHTITYIVLDNESGCTGFAQQEIYVHDLPTLNCEELNQSFCLDHGPVVLADLLQESPSGGTFYWNEVELSTFDPQESGPGSFTLTYVYSDPHTHCTNSCQFTLVIHELPQLNSPVINLCNTSGDEFVENIDITSFEATLSTNENLSYQYFTDEELTNELSNPENTTISHEEVFWVLAIDLLTGCKNTTSMMFTLSDITPTSITAEICDESDTGSLTVYNLDLNDYNYDVYPSGPETSYTWYWDEELQSPVSIPIAELTGGPHTFWVEIQDGECLAAASLEIVINPLPNVTSAISEYDICHLSDELDLNTTFQPNPSGGTFYQNNTAITSFNPITTGTFNITYIFEDPTTGCASSIPLTIVVNQLPQASNISDLLCDEDGSGEITGFDLTFYHSSINADDDVDFDWFLDEELTQPVNNPANVTINNENHTFFARVTDANGCTSIATVTFDLAILNVEDHTVSECDQSGAEGLQELYNINLNNYNADVAPFQQGIVYEWFLDEELTTPAPATIAVIGDQEQFWVKITLGWCIEVARVTFVVYELPEISCHEEELVFCRNDEDVDLSDYVSPSGGVFSGPGVNSSGVFNPNAMVGYRKITYRITDSETGCIVSCALDIMVHPLPQTSNQNNIRLCDPSGSTVINLNDHTDGLTNDDNATFSFYHDEDLTDLVIEPENTSVSNNDRFWAKVTNQNNCYNKASMIFRLRTGLDVEDLTLTRCDETEGNQQIHNIVLNSFNNDFYPISALIQYEWFDMDDNPVDGATPIDIVNDGDQYKVVVTFDNCTEVGILTFSVLPLPEVDCDFTLPELCANDEPFDLMSLLTEPAGTFSGPGVSENMFDPSIAGSGTHTLFYSFTDEDSCTAQCEFTVEVTELPLLDCIDTLYFCSGAGIQLLDFASPEGGTYSGPGVFEDDGSYYFDPALPETGVGEHTIFYTWEDPETNCSGTCEIVVSVQEIPDVQCDGDQQICINHGILILDELCPNPGTFSGNGVSYNETAEVYEFDPETAGTGDHLIIHYFTHPLTLIEYTCEFTITVHPLPIMSCSEQDKGFCFDYGDIFLAEEFSPLPEGGIFLLNGSEISTFIITESGEFEIEYYFEDPETGCFNSCFITLTIYEELQTNDLSVSLCDAEGEGSVTINLTHYQELIYDDPEATFTFFLDAGLTELAINPENISVTEGDQIWVLTEDENGCTDTAVLSFSFITIELEDTVIEACHDSEEGTQQISNINLHTFNDEIFPSGAGINFKWFTDPSLDSEYEVTTVATLYHGDVYYVAVYVGDCTFSASVTFTIFPLPVMICPAITACDFDEFIDLDTVDFKPENGVFTGEWIDGSIFDIQAAGPGYHEIIYTYTSSQGCKASCTTEVFVFGVEGFECPDDFQVCLNEGIVTLDMALPPGGTYSGPGVLSSAGTFNPLVAGTGDHIITYSYGGQGCTYTCTFVITVLPLPQISCPEDIILCEADQNIILNLLPHSPAGGEFSGDFVDQQNGDFIFNTEAAGYGIFVIEYHYTDPLTACINHCSFEIRVNPLPTVEWESDRSFCSNEGLVKLTFATPANGIYSGSHVSDGMWFNTSQAGAGIHPVLYTYTDNNGCTTQSEATITVHEAPVAFAGPDLYLNGCGSVQLGGSASLGTPPYDFMWSPAYLLNNPQSQNPTTASLGGDTEFLLTVTDQNGCSDSDNMNIIVQNGSVASIPEFDPLCQNATPFELTGGEPEGGQYFINDNNEPDTSFDPMLTGAGDHLVYYIIEDENECFITAQTVVTVYPLPEITWDGLEFCAFSGLEELTIALPSGGFYSGEFVQTNKFNTNESGPGIFDVVYTFTDQLGCTASKAAEVVVHELPLADAGPDQAIPAGSYTTLEAGDPGNGSFSFQWAPEVFLVSPQQQTTFTRELLFTQIFRVFTTDEQTGCTARDETVVTITGGQLEFVFLMASPNVICHGEETEFRSLVSGGAPPYQYFWYTENPQLNEDATHINDNISERNFSLAPEINQTYFLKVTDANENEIFRSITPLVNPLPIVSLDLPEFLCYDTGINLNDYADPQGGTFYFVNENGDHFLPADTAEFPQFNTADTGTGLLTIYYEYTNNSGCKSSATGVTEVVKITPEFSSEQPENCSPSQIAFFNQTDPLHESFTYLWEFGDNETSVEEHPSHLFINNTSSPIEYTVVLTITGYDNCVGLAEETITVFPAIQAVISASKDETGPADTLKGCAPLTIDFSATQSLNATHFLWDFGDGLNASNQATVTHTFTKPGLYNIVLWAGNENNCSDTQSVLVMVHPQPESRFVTSNQSGCSPITTDISYLFEPDQEVIYEWDFTGSGEYTQFQANELPLYHVYANDGTDALHYQPTLRAVSEKGCISEYSRNLMVFPEVTAVITHDQQAQYSQTPAAEGCNPVGISFSASNSQNSNFFSWNFGDGTTSSSENPTHTFFYQYPDTATEYNVTLTTSSIFGCTTKDSLSVMVFPAPTAFFEAHMEDGCNPGEFSFTNLSQGATSYHWDFGDQNTSTDPEPVHIYTLNDSSQAESFIVTLTATNENGCTKTFSQTLWVYPQVVANFKISASEGCHPVTIEFTNLSSGPENGLTYEWNYGDGQQSSNAQTSHIHTFKNNSHTNDTTYVVGLTVTYLDQCSSYHEKTVTVKARPKASFSLDQNQGCAPLPITATNHSEGGSNFLWDFGDNSEPYYSDETEIAHQYHNTSAAPGIYTITLTATGQNGCSHEKSHNVMVYPQLTALFDASTREGCNPLTVSFENLSAGADNYLWSFGDESTSSLQNPTYVFTNQNHSAARKWIVTLHTSSIYGCTSEYSDTITVNPAPVVAWSLSDYSGCSEFAPVFSNESSYASTFQWDFGDGNTSQEETPQHSWSNTGSSIAHFEVSLTTGNTFGCNSTKSRSVHVYPQIEADFTTENNIFEGCSPLEVRFENLSTGSTQHTWSFGNGNTSQQSNPAHVFHNNTHNPLTFAVELIAASAHGCADTVTKEIIVYPVPEAGFSVYPHQQSYPSTTVEITNHFPGQPWSYLWNFGDGNTSETDEPTFSHTYQWNEDDLSSREYEITLVTYNDFCSAHAQQNILITSPAPVAMFEAELVGCSPYEISLSNQSLYAHTYRWYFGDGSVSGQQNPQHVYHYPGNYALTLVVTGDGGRDTIQATVEVLPSPTAGFEVKSGFINLPSEPLEVINNSLLATSWYWEFGDGGTSTAFEPVYYYSDPGIYDITLTVHTDSEPQCSHSITLYGAVRAEHTCKIVFPNAFTPSVTGPSGGSYSPGNTNRQIFYPFHQGVEEYRLEIFNRWGELIFTSNDPMIGWDGYVRGRLAGMGVYVWKVTAVCTTGRTINKAGDVTLIR